MSAPAARPSTGLLDGPILPTLLRLALPNVMAMVLTVLVGVAETVYIGRLGTTPLAAMAVVFPFAMLTQMLSAGAMGGGVSSAISRALGAGDLPRARALARHAMAIGLLAGLLHAVVMLAGGPLFYRWVGARGEVLEQAVRYGNVLFAGATLVWLSNTGASILRGSGNMRGPSLVIVGSAVLQIALGGALSLGFGPLPSLGMTGVALGHIVATAAAVVAFVFMLTRPQARVRLQADGSPWRRDFAADILRVGALSCLSPLMAVLTMLALTGLVARLGVDVLAGYGIGQRLEFMLVPVAFGIGVAAVPMVGMAIGAGQVARARRVAWTAGGVSAFNLGMMGLVVAVWPDLWATLFTRDPAVLQAARQYLQTVGPAFPFFGLGLTLYFASQGAGRVLGPVLAAVLRLLLVWAVGRVLLAQPPDVMACFALVAGAMAAYGLATAGAVAITRWQGPAARA